MDKSKAQAACVEAIIDAELDATELAVQAYDSATEPAKRIGALVRKVLELQGRGVSPVQIATKAREAFENLALLEYARLAQGIADRTEASLAHEMKAIRELNLLGGSVVELPMIRNVDMKNRAMVRAGALNKAGKVDPNGDAT